MPKRIPVTVVSGFLGTGKTTVIRHLITTSSERLAIIVNEFGSVGLDGDLIKNCGFCSEDEINSRVVELNNGCLCCTVQEDFLPAMEALLERKEQLDGIVIETSGLALPRPLLQALEWPAIRSKVFVNGVVTLVDGQALKEGSPVGNPDALLIQREADPNLDHLTSIDELFNDQLNAADLVLISKSDCIDQDDIQKLLSKLSSSVNPGTQIIPITNGQITSSLLLGLRDLTTEAIKNRSQEDHSYIVDGHSGDHHNHVDAFTDNIRIEKEFNREILIKSLVDIAKRYQALRIKGRLWLPGKAMPLQIQMVGPRINSWFEESPVGTWKPSFAGLDIVVISLKKDFSDEFKEDLNRICI